MSTIINKSNHPVEVKKINIQIWKLRDEIEKSISLRLEETGGNSEDLDIEDIKAFYTRNKPKYLDPNYDPEDDDQNADNVVSIGSEGEGEDSNNKKMDGEALSNLNALEDEADEQDSNEAEESENNEESDDEAAKLAAEMLDDKGAPNGATEELSDQTAPTKKKIKKLKRIHPNIDKLSKGFSLLSDLNMDNIVFFSKHAYTFGQNITIEFLIPNKFMISAEVKTCVDLKRNSKIISETKPNYRVEADLTYLWDGERSSLRDFLKSVEPEIPPAPKKMKRPESEDEDDDEFEDLGF